MEDGAKNIAKIVVIVVCLVAAVVLSVNFMGVGGGGGGVTDETERAMVCEECGNKYTISEGEFKTQIGEKSSGEMMMGQLLALDCPECGEEAAFRAIKCSKCSEIFTKGEAQDNKYPDKCPKCGFSEIEERFGGK